MANKMGLEFKGFDEVIANYEAAGGNVQRAVDGALKQSKQLVTSQLQQAIRRHRRTGQTEASLDKNMTVQWDAYIASVDVGFHIRQGGLASVFLMYGTPRVPKDQALYNAVYSSRTKNQIKKLQEQAVNKAIQRTLGGK